MQTPVQNSNSQHSNSGSQSAENGGASNEWENVYVAINTRWPEVSMEELSKQERKPAAISKYVSEKVKADSADIDAVIKEFAPSLTQKLHKYVDPITEQVHHAGEVVSTSLHSAVERVQYEVDEAPFKTSIATFVFGVGIGVLLTTLFHQSRPEPTAWQQFKARRIY